MMTSISLGSNARGRATRQRLLDSAAACFGEHGYARVRISDVTDRAEVSHGAFYRHFRDKRELLLESLREPLDELLHATAATSDVALTHQAVAATTASFYSVYARHRRVLRVLREMVADHDPELTEVWLDIRRRYIGRIEAWLRASGSVSGSGVDVPLLAEAMGAVLEQLAYTHLGLAPGEVPDGEVERLAQVTAHVWSASIGLPR